MNRQGLRQNQTGMVAIMTTMILMIVISLIVLGFSQIVRRNQRQVLDAQLSSQAFYAAESGINLAKEALSSNSAYEKTACGTDSTITDYAVDGTNVAVTCLLISPANNLVFDSVSSTSKVSLIEPTSGGVDSIFINWQSITDGNVSASCGAFSVFPAQGAWSCNQPVLRVDLVPLGGSLSIDSVRDTQFTAFLHPQRLGGASTPVSWGSATGNNKGRIQNVICNDTTNTDKVRKCSAQIQSLPGGARYGIRMMSIYGDAKVEVHVRSGGVQPTLRGGQVVVDSTARAVDVLKRVQARVSVIRNDSIPDFGVLSSAFCKRYLVQPATGVVAVDGSSPAIDACNL